MPKSQSSPQIIPSILPYRSCITCSAVVGLGLPEIFALGAAIGQPDSLISVLATSLEGSLTPTVSSPPVVTSGTMSFRLTIIVIGPGQNASIKARISLLISSVSFASSLVSAM